MNDDLDYAGVAPCGCWKMLASAKSDTKELAKWCALVIRRGYDLQRWSKEQIKAGTSQCAVCKPVKQGTLE